MLGPAHLSPDSLSTCPCGTGTAHGPACPDLRPVHLAIDMGPPRPSPSARHAKATGRNSGDGLPSWPPALGRAIALDPGHAIADPRPRENGTGRSRPAARAVGVQGLRHHLISPAPTISSDPGDGIRFGRRWASRRHRAPLCKGSPQRPCTAVVNGPGCPHVAAATCTGIAAEGPEGAGSSAGARSRQSPSHGWPCLGAPNGASSDILRRGHPAVARPGP